MCLYNDPQASKVWLKENKDKPFIVVFKRFNVWSKGLFTPYQLRSVDLTTNVFKSDSKCKGGRFSNKRVISRGIHCYENKQTAKTWQQRREIVVKMHALPEDFIGYYPLGKELVFTKLYFPDDVWAKLLAKYHPDLCVPEDN